ncbi:hypothetical protein Hanom_Chr03g00219791 [Helianthus anomalus]
MGCQKCEIKLLMVNNQFDLKNLDLDRSQGVVQKDMILLSMLLCEVMKTEG